MNQLNEYKSPFYGLLYHYLLNKVQYYWESLEQYI